MPPLLPSGLNGKCDFHGRRPPRQQKQRPGCSRSGFPCCASCPKERASAELHPAQTMYSLPSSGNHA
eukprot:9013430-Alexandrium_andersonii.AAC.1